MLLTAVIVMVAVSQSANAANYSFVSQEQRTTLIELYTSEGCSSCPPADRWLSRLKNDPQLWRRFIPIAFHVDYWDYLGWRDRFSDARFSHRQENYQRHGLLPTVYTPGVMKNGREWRSWNHARLTFPHDIPRVGILKADITGDTLVAEFAPLQQYASPLVLNVTRLGFDLITRVAAGENSGKSLTHDFTVLNFHQQIQTAQNHRFHWVMTIPAAQTSQGTAALALWVSLPDDPTPIQAAGGWLK